MSKSYEQVFYRSGNMNVNKYGDMKRIINDFRNVNRYYIEVLLYIVLIDKNKSLMLFYIGDVIYLYDVLDIVTRNVNSCKYFGKEFNIFLYC